MIMKVIEPIEPTSLDTLTIRASGPRRSSGSSVAKIPGPSSEVARDTRPVREIGTAGTGNDGHIWHGGGVIKVRGRAPRGTIGGTNDTNAGGQ